MKLRYIYEVDELERDVSYWEASTENGNFSETGHDPLTAVTRLTVALEFAHESQ